MQLNAIPGRVVSWVPVLQMKLRAFVFQDHSQIRGKATTGNYSIAKNSKMLPGHSQGQLSIFVLTLFPSSTTQEIKGLSHCTCPGPSFLSCRWPKLSTGLIGPHLYRHIQALPIFFRLHLFSKYFMSPAPCLNTVLTKEDSKAVRHKRYPQGVHRLVMGTDKK